jgi:hypothetical protein
VLARSGPLHLSRDGEVDAKARSFRLGKASRLRVYRDLETLTEFRV